MKFRKKPIVIEAEHFATFNDAMKIAHFTRKAMSPVIDGPYTHLLIRTLEGTMQVSEGDWVIKGVNGEFYPCKPDIFEKTYEKVED